MSPQDFRRMVLAWELVPQNAALPDDEQAPSASNRLSSPPADEPGTPAITSAILRERLQDA